MLHWTNTLRVRYWGCVWRDRQRGALGVLLQDTLGAQTWCNRLSCCCCCCCLAVQVLVLACRSLPVGTAVTAACSRCLEGVCGRCCACAVCCAVLCCAVSVCCVLCAVCCVLCACAVCCAVCVLCAVAAVCVLWQPAQHWSGLRMHAALPFVMLPLFSGAAAATAAASRRCCRLVWSTCGCQMPRQWPCPWQHHTAGCGHKPAARPADTRLVFYRGLAGGCWGLGDQEAMVALPPGSTSLLDVVTNLLPDLQTLGEQGGEV